jgi:hypothetical protein
MLLLLSFPAAAQVQQGSDFQINTYTNGDEEHPSVAVGADGGFPVVWQSAQSAGGDTSGTSIQGTRLDDAVFLDGFERGHLTRWSGVVLGG